MMLHYRTRTLSITLPVTLIIVFHVLALMPANVTAQCPSLSQEGFTYGITKFNPVKAQMWYNDGLWWGVFSDNDTGLHIYSFPNNSATQGPIVDGNINGIPDVLWDDTNLFVFIWKSVSLATLYKYTYTPATQTYNLISGFPVNIPLNGSATSAIVMDKDTTGKLWATYTGTQGGLSDGKVRVIWSTSADHKTWDTTGTALETGLATNTLEISAITHFGGDKIGVAWSNQPGLQIAFKYHIDGQAESSWSAKEVIDSGRGPRNLGPVADDHLAIKPLPDGRIFLLAKDNDNDGSAAHAIEGRLWLYVRTAAGVWGQKTIVQPDFSQLPTRPVLLLDNTHNTAYVIYHDESPSGSGRNFITHTDMNTLSFDFPCVFNLTPSTNPTSTKQDVTPTTGIMAAASTGSTSTNDIVFRSVDLNINPMPVITSLSPSSANAGGPGFTLTINGTGFVSTSIAQWNDVDRPTTFISDTQLTIPITTADTITPGTALVTVTSPLPGGGLSSPEVFTINQMPMGYESDVAPRPNGSNNGSVSIADWVQTGRFAAGLDVPNIGSEFQRADSAPKSTFGNGAISISDWVQAGRYAAGLDAVNQAAGPTGPGSAPQTYNAAKKGSPATANANRMIRVVGNDLNAGQTASVFLQLDSQGDENSLGFSVNFSTSQLSFVSAAVGSDSPGALLLTNTNSAGKVGVAISLPAGQSYAAGSRQIVVLNFAVAANASGSTTLSFGDQPIGREVVDANTNVLTTNYASTTLNIILNPMPSSTSLAPGSAVAGGPAFTLTVNGSNFVNGSVVRWNGSDRATTFVNASQLTTQISAADIASPGSAAVTVFNPTPGGGTASPLTFTIISSQPNPPQLDFNSQTFTVSEGAGTATITVTRSGDVSGSASVDFGINDSIGYAPCLATNHVAAQNCDYTITAGTLQFAPGETSKSFSIPLVDDAIVEGDETLTVKLSNAVGASLGSLATATVTVVDNDTAAPSSNPIDQSDFFVRQHYLDFLNREPDAGGLGYWSGQISQCGSDQGCIHSQRIGVSGAFFVELEFQITGSVVYRLYKASYGQTPTYTQFMPDRSQLVAGPQLQATTIAFANRFVQRPEFKNVYSDAMSNSAFVNKLYDSAGIMNNATQRQQAIDSLNGGSSRAQILLDLIETPEFKTREYNPSFVLMQYFGYLRRDPDQGGYDFWLNILNNREPNNYRGMICSFLTSREYQERFSPVVTRSNSQCGQ